MPEPTKPRLEPGEMTDDELEYVAGGVSPAAKNWLIAHNPTGTVPGPPPRIDH